MQQEYLVNELSDWQIVANDLVEYLSKNTDVKYVLLNGNLGAGKTTFVQYIVKRYRSKFGTGYGSNDLVQSPTFSLVNEYQTHSHHLSAVAEPVYHLDLYRLKNQQELIEAGIIDIIASGKLCFIEWPDLIKPFIDKTALNVNIELLENGNRSINLQRL